MADWRGSALLVGALATLACMPVPASAASLVPDLVAEEVVFSVPLLEGVLPDPAHLLVSLVVDETEGIAAGPFTVRFNYTVGTHGGTIGEVAAPPLAPFGRAFVNVTWNVTGRVGEYRVDAVVDPRHLVAEAREGNNNASRTRTLVTSDPSGGTAAMALDATLGGSSPVTAALPGDYDSDGIPDRGDFWNQPSEARVRTRPTDFADFTLVPNAAVSLVSPEGRALAVTSVKATGVVRVFFDGSTTAPPGDVTVAGDLLAAIADGTWTIHRGTDQNGDAQAYSLSIAGKRLAGVSASVRGEPYEGVLWNWHMQHEASKVRGATLIGGVIVDPGECIVYARFYGPDFALFSHLP